MLVKKTVGIFSKLSINPLLSRQISTKLTISPTIIDEIYGGLEANSSSLVPNSRQINQHQKRLQQLYQENPDFKKFADNLFKAYNNPNVKSIAIAFARQANPDELNKNPYFQPTLIATSLFAGIGLVPFYNQENFPAYALVNKESTSEISGHQDSMFLDPNDKHLNLIPTLLLVNGYSQSNAKTWVKESPDIISEFKEKYPSSHGVLKSINFICKSRNIDEIGNRAPHKIIGEHDEINFVSNFIYSPIPTDLARFNISKEEVDLAILRFKEVVNSKKNRHEFVVNNNGVQFLVIKNTQAVHGRGEVEEDNKGNRYVIGIPIHPDKPPSSARTRMDFAKIEDKKESTTHTI